MMSGDAKGGSVPNPWFDFRNAWTSREAAARSRERMWQIVALFSVLIAIFALGGLIYYANSSKYIPYVVEVDKLGAAMGVKPADRMARADPRVVRYAIANFITEARLVSPDVNVQRRAVFRVYALLNQNDVAFAKMNEYMNGSEESTPFARAQKTTVETEIVSMIPQTETSWEIDWVETVRNRNNGEVLEKYRMRANLSYYFAPVDRTQTAESLFYNPLALFVRDFNWGRIQESSGD
jgi:type IV secretion system protein VirB5